MVLDGDEIWSIAPPLSTGEVLDESFYADLNDGRNNDSTLQCKPWVIMLTCAEQAKTCTGVRF